jgi:hypothetical protein
MNASFDTLLLSVDQWDLTVDSLGNIARASAPYALAQDVASAARTFLGEVYYDTTVGVPYLQQILGKNPPAQFIQNQLAAAALTVPGVVKATCIINSFVPSPGPPITGPPLLDSSGHPILDSSGNFITTLPALPGQQQFGRNIVGQILFTDANGVTAGVAL